MKKYGKKADKDSEVKLNITAIADIMVVLIVFILKASAAGVAPISPVDNLKLPQARANDDLVELIRVEISPDRVILNEKPVLPLSRFQFNPGDVNEGGSITTVKEAIKREAEKEKQSNSQTEKAKKILVLADRAAPYSTVRRVLQSASEEGFVNFKLVVLKNE